MDIVISHRAQSIKPSPTLSVSARAAQLCAEGRDIIDLGAGEPDFDTPEHIKAAAVEALRQGFTKYTPIEGTSDLKQAIIGKFRRENNLEFKPAQIIVSCGAKHSLYNLMQALLNPGDEVIIPAPYWVSYPDMARLAGAEPVIIKTGIHEGFKINRSQLRGAITKRTRLFVLNSPSNPTGVSYTNNELKELSKILLDHPEIIVVTDDIYEHVLWGQEKFSNILNVCPDLYDQTVVVNGVSKAYAMTGWRIGYVGGPASLVGAMKKIQSQSTSNPTSIAQVAARAALEGDQSYIAESTRIFKERHDFVYKELGKIKGIECQPSDGTFYIFPNMTGIIERMENIDDDLQLAEHFLEKAGVALVPGSAFGAPGCMRISFATSMEKLKDALNRIKNAI